MAQGGDLAAAIEAQERAVAHLRSTAADDRDTLVRLSVLLYNLEQYYSKAERWHDAVTALAEVVALDERTGHDLASDRAALEQARGEFDRHTLLAWLGETAERTAADESPDAPWA